MFSVSCNFDSTFKVLRPPFLNITTRTLPSRNTHTGLFIFVLTTHPIWTAFMRSSISYPLSSRKFVHRFCPQQFECSITKLGVWGYSQAEMGKSLWWPSWFWNLCTFTRHSPLSLIWDFGLGICFKSQALPCGLPTV